MTRAVGASPVAPAIALVLAVLAAYLPSLFAPFQFDDWWQVVDDPRVQSLPAWWQAMPGIRPLLKLSFALNASLAPEPWGLRLVNVCVHALNGVLLLALMRRWLPGLGLAAQPAARAAFAAAAVFALHPAATEAVTYVSGRSVSLMAMFYLASLLALARVQESAHTAQWRLLSAALFALALAVRETAVTLPLAWLLFARCSGQSWRDAVRPLRAHGLVLLVAAAAAAFTPGYRSFFSWSLHARGLVSQCLGQLEAHVYLLTGPLPALRLNIDPDLHVPSALTAAGVALVALALALAVLSWRRRRAWPWLAFGLAWYVLQLAPSNSLLPRFDLANDRHLYMALVGPWLLVTIGLAKLPRVAYALALALLVTALAAATLHRNHDYRSERSLWEDTVRHSPGKARPWLNLGHARQLAGDVDGALAAYRCAVSREPGRARDQAAVNLAVLAAEYGVDPVTAVRAGDCAPP